MADEYVFEGALGIEYLNTVIHPVTHVDVARRVYCNAVRTIELALPVASGAEGHQEIAVGIKFLDPVILPISDVDIPGLVDGDSPGHVELTFRFAQRTPFGDVLPLWR